MKTPPFSITIDGVVVGTSTALTVPDGKEIRVNLRFRPYWPGLFHLMALLADQQDGRRKRGHSAGS